MNLYQEILSIFALKASETIVFRIRSWSDGDCAVMDIFFTIATKQCSTKLDLTLTHLWELHCNAVYQVWPPVTMVMRARQGVMCADRILLHLRNRISCNSYCVVSLECAELCEAEKSAMKSRFRSVCGQVTYSTRVNRRAWSRWPFFITSKCNQWENI